MQDTPKGTIQLMSKTQFAESGIIDPDIQAAFKDVYDATNFAAQFDALCQLRAACQAKKDGTELGAQAENFLKHMTNSSNAAELNDAIAKRERLIELGRMHVPVHGTPAYDMSYWEAAKGERAREMIEKVSKGQTNQIGKIDFFGEELSLSEMDEQREVTYLLDQSNRDPYRVMPAEGKLWKMQASTGDDVGLAVVPFDTSQYHDNNVKGRAIFVVSPDGVMYAGSGKDSEFHHSSFLGGNAVDFGGTIETDQNGNLARFDNGSGHYKPNEVGVLGAAKLFKQQDLIKPTTVIEQFDETSHRNVTLNTKGFLEKVDVAKARADKLAVDKRLESATIKNTQKRLGAKLAAAKFGWMDDIQDKLEAKESIPGCMSRLDTYYSELNQSREELEKLKVSTPQADSEGQAFLTRASAAFDELQGELDLTRQNLLLIKQYEQLENCLNQDMQSVDMNLQLYDAQLESLGKNQAEAITMLQSKHPDAENVLQQAKTKVADVAAKSEQSCKAMANKFNTLRGKFSRKTKSEPQPESPTQKIT